MQQQIPQHPDLLRFPEDQPHKSVKSLTNANLGWKRAALLGPLTLTLALIIATIALQNLLNPLPREEFEVPEVCVKNTVSIVEQPIMHEKEQS